MHALDSKRQTLLALVVAVVVALVPGLVGIVRPAEQTVRLCGTNVTYLGDIGKAFAGVSQTVGNNNERALVGFIFG